MSGVTGGDTLPIGEEMQRQYKLLCSKLEEMKVIFKLQDEGVELFPIGKLLATVIGREYAFERIDEVTLNTFLLALEIFDAESYNTVKTKLDEIIDNCNLKFLRYISKPSVRRIGGSLWKSNFRDNGVLILADVTERIIYIRHPEKKYFKQLDYKEIKQLESETNSTGKEIAYYYEYNYNANATHISMEKIMLSENCNMQLAAIREVYNNNLYNVFFDDAFLKIGEEVKVVNPFTTEDKALVLDGRNSIEANVENITDYAMKPFSLIKIFGKQLDYIIIGSICKLLSICNVSIDEMADELKCTNKGYQNVLIQSWLKHSENIYESMVKFQELYFNDIRYIRKRDDIAKKRIIDISWIPVSLSNQILNDALKGHCSEIIDGDVVYELLKIDEDFEGNIDYYKVETDTKVVPESIILYNEDNLEEGMIYSIQYQDKYFVSREIDNYIKLIKKIDDGNKGLHRIEEFEICSEPQIQIIIGAMKLQEQALKDIADCIVDFESIAKLRIIHHIIYNQILQKGQWINFIEVVNGHQKLEYGFVKKYLNLFEDNVLVVPKEKQESGSALTSIINKYFRENAVRSRDVYLSEIEMEQKDYTYRGKTIEKIIFLFDTLQSGTSTIRNLKFYFEEYEMATLDNVKNQHVKYYCNGKEVKLETIIERNQPKVEVVVLYGSRNGKKNVEKHLITNEFINIKKVTCIEEIEKIVDKSFMDKVFEVYDRKYISIEESNFPIIREFNQPKRNAFPRDALISENIASILVKKKEFIN